MKAFVILFVIALVLSCSINGFFNMPMYPLKTGVVGVSTTENPAGMRRSDTMIPDMQMTDGYRPIYMMTKVGDREQDQQTEFPMQALQ